MDEILHIKNLSKRYGDTNVLKNINISVKKGEVVVIIGPSGCGKSMTLKSIAGIETPTEGKIQIGEHVLFDSKNKVNLKPQKRKIGYLFQNYALFPTMTVAQNIATGLKGSKQEK